MSIKDNLEVLNRSIPEKVKLVAVSKTKPIEAIQEAFDAGQRVFGENRAIEFADKVGQCPNDIEWHYIGHLQTNKVKFVAPYATYIHSVDSLKLLKEIDKQAKKHDRIVNCLLQFHIALETNKFGLDLEEARDLIHSDVFSQFSNVKICGVMGMATFTEDEEVIREEFKSLKHYFDMLKEHDFADDSDFKEISMGMSGDYHIAIEEGSTMVRVGSAIFGVR